MIGRIIRGAGALLLLLALGAAPPRAAEQCPTATLDAARALAERAAAFLSASGPDVAFPRFMNPQGGFVAGDLYVFVFDLNGRLRASGGWPETVGARVTGDNGAGSGIYTRMRRLALDAGKGWIEYSWYNPCTRKMEPKASYIVRVGDFIVGVGAYKKPGV
jgi:cytochrome c